MTKRLCFSCNELHANGEHCRKPWHSSQARRAKPALIRRDGNQCSICGETADLHVDHIVPRMMGGSDLLDNLQLLCKRCNLHKGAS